MGLSLVVGPAHAGKVALLLDRFVDALLRRIYDQKMTHLRNLRKIDRDIYRYFKVQDSCILLGRHFQTFKPVLAIHDTEKLTITPLQSIIFQ